MEAAYGSNPTIVWVLSATWFLQDLYGVHGVRRNGLTLMQSARNEPLLVWCLSCKLLDLRNGVLYDLCVWERVLGSVQINPATCTGIVPRVQMPGRGMKIWLRPRDGVVVSGARDTGSRGMTRVEY